MTDEMEPQPPSPDPTPDPNEAGVGGHDPEPEQSERVSLPLPDVPLPLGVFFGVLPVLEGKDFIVFVTTSNPSGSMCQGYLDAESAVRIGVSLAQNGQQAIQARPAKLIVPEGLVVPGR
jgi:hypothetical protein